MARRVSVCVCVYLCLYVRACVVRGSAGVGELGARAGREEPPLGVRDVGAALHRQGRQEERDLVEQACMI